MAALDVGKRAEVDVVRAGLGSTGRPSSVHPARAPHVTTLTGVRISGFGVRSPASGSRYSTAETAHRIDFAEEERLPVGRERQWRLSVRAGGQPLGAPGPIRGLPVEIRLPNRARGKRDPLAIRRPDRILLDEGPLVSRVNVRRDTSQIQMSFSWSRTSSAMRWPSGEIRSGQVRARRKIQPLFMPLTIERREVQDALRRRRCRPSRRHSTQLRPAAPVPLLAT